MGEVLLLKSFHVLKELTELENGQDLFLNVRYVLLAITVLKEQMTRYNILVLLGITVSKAQSFQLLVLKEPIEIKSEEFHLLLACLAGRDINVKKVQKT